MNRDEFEILVCEALDESERDDLRAAIDGAVADDPALAAVCDEWRRFDGLLRRGWPEPRVDWAKLAPAIAQSLDHPPTAGMHDVAMSFGAGSRSEDSENADQALDLTIAGQTSHGRVDWKRLQGRISDAVSVASLKSRRRMSLRLVAWSFIGVAAAAAALVMMVRPAWLIGTGRHLPLGDLSNTPIAVARGSSGDSGPGEAKSAPSAAEPAVAAAPAIANVPAAASAVVVASVLSADRSPSAAAARISASVTESADQHAGLGQVAQADSGATPDDESRRFIMIEDGEGDDVADVPAGA